MNKERVKYLVDWIADNPGKFDGIAEKRRELALIIESNPDLDPIQNNCKYGFVLPDRCRYNNRLGCDCGAYRGTLGA